MFRDQYLSSFQFPKEKKLFGVRFPPVSLTEKLRKNTEEGGAEVGRGGKGGDGGT
jgi:hypothetical protein